MWQKHTKINRVKDRKGLHLCLGYRKLQNKVIPSKQKLKGQIIYRTIMFSELIRVTLNSCKLNSKGQQTPSENMNCWLLSRRDKKKVAAMKAGNQKTTDILTIS